MSFFWCVCPKLCKAQKYHLYYLHSWSSIFASGENVSPPLARPQKSFLNLWINRWCVHVNWSAVWYIENHMLAFSLSLTVWHVLFPPSRMVDFHYDDVIMSAIGSQITSLTIVYSIVSSDADQRKHQSSTSLAFVWGIHRVPVNSPHKWPVTRKMCPYDDVIMWYVVV